MPSELVSKHHQNMWTLHPSSKISDTAIQLCGIKFTLNAYLHLFGTFFGQSVRDLEVNIHILYGVFREMFDSWISAILQSVSFPNIEVDAAQSIYAVDLFKLWGFAQRGVFF